MQPNADKPEITKIAHEVRERLKRVRNYLLGKTAD